MAETIQVIGAAVALAETSLRVACLLRKFAKARSEARDLYEYTAHLRSLALRVTTVLKARTSEDELHGGPPAGGVKDTLASIRRSIDACEGSLGLIPRVLQRLAKESESSWMDRVKYVLSSDMIRKQERMIVLHLQLLAIDMSLLQNLDQRQMMGMLRSVASVRDRLKEDADKERSQVSRAVDKMEASTRRRTSVDGRRHSFDESTSTMESLEGASTLPLLDTVDSVSEQEIFEKTHPSYLQHEAASLAIAVRRKDAEAVATLLAHGLDIAVTDEDDWTLLHHASYNLDVATLTELLYGPSRLPPGFLDRITKRGETALMLIARQAECPASLSAAEQLLQAGCDPNVVQRGELRRDALYYVIERSKTPQRARFVDLLVVKYRARIDLVKQSFPQGMRQYECLRNALDWQPARPSDGDEIRGAQRIRKTSWAGKGSYTERPRTNEQGRRKSTN